MKNIFRLTVIAGSVLVTGVVMAQLSHNETRFGSKNIASKGFAVVELFTSEGCSSCPPADAVLARIAKSYPENVVVIGFHVDYWNRLGWRDPYSDAAYSQRQNQYAAVQGADGVYTPQAIVNGTSQLVGSEEQKLRNIIDDDLAGQAGKAIKINVTLPPNSYTLTVSYQFEGKPGTLLNIALLQRSSSTKVRAGENEGRTLSHINIVRDFKMVAEKEGAIQLDIPASLTAQDCAVVAYSQEKETMQITGTTLITAIP